MKGILNSNFVAQIGIVVRDIEKTCEEFSKIFGVEKPNIIITDAYEKSRTEYRGKPTYARAKLAFFNFQNIVIELIEPDENPSTWREFLDNYGEGIHHLGFEIKGMKEKIENFERLGIKIAQRGEYEGGRYTYLDTLKQLKFIIELLEND